MNVSDRGTPTDAALLAEYAEVNSNFRLLTDIRFKLLALLPLAAAVAVGLGLMRQGHADRGSMAIAFLLFAFGLSVTVALASYNERNDQLYLWMVTRGAQIERELGLFNGSFAYRPNSWLEIPLWRGRCWPVGHSSSIQIMYAAAVVLWTIGATISAGQFLRGGQPLSVVADVLLALLSVGLAVACIRLVATQKARRRQKLTEAGKRAKERVGPLLRPGGLETYKGTAGFEEFVEACVELIGRDHRPKDRRDEVLFRIDFYDRMDAGERLRHGLGTASDEREAERYVSLISDLPPYIFTKAPLRR